MSDTTHERIHVIIAGLFKYHIPLDIMSRRSGRYYCWGCGKTFQSYKAMAGHVGRCFWYQFYKADDNLEAAPFHPSNIATSLSFMNTVNKQIGLRYREE